MEDIRTDENWLALRSFLPADLDAMAVESGALVRRRVVKDGVDLIRLALAYADEGASLREVSAWARDSGLADLSDVALLKRLRSSVPFLRLVVSSLLEPVPAEESPLQLRLLDSTVLSRQRSKSGGDFKVHVGYNVQSGCVSGIELTDMSRGDGLGVLPVRPGEVVVADMAYNGRKPLWELLKAGAEVLVRTHPRLCSLLDEAGTKVDLSARACALMPGDVLDIAVWTKPFQGVPSLPGRLLAVRASERSAQAELHKRMKKARKDGQKATDAQKEAAKYIFLFTTLDGSEASAKSAFEAYRLRWQVEMLFKRLKGVVTLGELKPKDKLLCEALVLAKLVQVLLIQKMEGAFSPWGYQLRGAESGEVAKGQAKAYPASGQRSPQPAPK